MLLEIIWSKFAESQLEEIFEYYSNNVNSKVARKLVKGIINAPKALTSTPYIGQVEELLGGREIQYRYLVFSNYKLIYSVDEENGFIKIADVFDTRQNPPKMKRTK